MVCRAAFLTAHSISLFYFQKVKKALKLDTPYELYSIRMKRNRKNPKQRLCKSWISEYIQKFCCHDPSSKEVHLPSMMTKKSFYDIFYQDLTQNLGYSKYSKELPNYSTFFSVWEKKFPNLKIPRNTRLGKCSTCTILKNKQPTFPKDGEFYQSVYQHHMKSILFEKQNYQDRIADSKINPGKLGSIIIDFFTKKYLPHNCTSVKEWLRFERMNVDLCGIINHGTGEQHFFPFMPHFSFTSDVNVSILHHMISYWREKNVLPHILHVQV
jgi:hypothetical protein